MPLVHRHEPVWVGAAKKKKDATKDVATFLIGSLPGDQNLGGSEWDTVKAGVAECFRDWGKRQAREERAEIKVVSDAILLLSKPLSGGPGVTALLLHCAKNIVPLSSDAGTLVGHSTRRAVGNGGLVQQKCPSQTLS
ncbi:hypothetical protein MRX96_014609 [Rhipicephalus microplus]